MAGGLVSGLRTLLCLACALMPLLHVPSDRPQDASRGVEGRVVLAQAMRVAIPDTVTPASIAVADLDEVCGNALPPCLAPPASLKADNPALPRSLGGIAATAGTRLDRPPRPSSNG